MLLGGIRFFFGNFFPNLEKANLKTGVGNFFPNLEKMEKCHKISKKRFLEILKSKFPNLEKNEKIHRISKFGKKLPTLEKNIYARRRCRKLWPKLRQKLVSEPRGGVCLRRGGGCVHISIMQKHLGWSSVSFMQKHVELPYL